MVLLFFSYIYRDVKPANFMIGFPGTDQAQTIYLIDFGLVKEYTQEQKTRTKPKTNQRLTGSMLFMSSNANFCLEQSPRDDLESLAYMFLYFLKGRLPWNFAYKSKYLSIKEHCFQVGSLKKSLTSDQIFEGCPKEFVHFLE